MARTWIIIGLGVCWTLAPLLGEVFESQPLYTTYPGMVFWGVSFAVVVGIIGVLARRKILTTVINRRLFATTMLVLGGQSMLGVGLWALGTPIVHAPGAAYFPVVGGLDDDRHRRGAPPGRRRGGAVGVFWRPRAGLSAASIHVGREPKI